MGLFSSPIKTLDDLFIHTVQDIYYAENQIAKNLPTMVEKASNSELKGAFQKHLVETKNHIKRLEQAFGTLGKEVKGTTCAAMDGILSGHAEPKPGWLCSPQQPAPPHAGASASNGPALAGYLDRSGDLARMDGRHRAAACSQPRGPSRLRDGDAAGSGRVSRRQVHRAPADAGNDR